MWASTLEFWAASSCGVHPHRECSSPRPLPFTASKMTHEKASVSDMAQAGLSTQLPCCATDSSPSEALSSLLNSPSFLSYSSPTLCSLHLVQCSQVLHKRETVSLFLLKRDIFLDIFKGHFKSIKIQHRNAFWCPKLLRSTLLPLELLSASVRDSPLGGQAAAKCSRTRVIRLLVPFQP